MATTTTTAKNPRRGALFYTLMTIAATLVILLPVGIANVVFGYIMDDSPCTLCWGQRISMMYIGLCAFFIVRYGFKTRYIATLLIFAAGGMYESYRQIAIHAMRDLDQGFGLAIWGIHTYSWAEFVFWCVIVLLGVMLFFAPRGGFVPPHVNGKPWFQFNKFEKICIWICTAIVASNLLQAIVSTGLPPNYGQGDPIRFSWNPEHIIHTDEGLQGMWGKVDFLGPRNVRAPDYAFAPNEKELGIIWNHESSSAPLPVDEQLEINQEIAFPVSTMLNTLALIGDEYVVSSKYKVFYFTKDLKLIEQLEIDPLYSATIDPIVGVMPWQGDKYILMGSNKSLLRYEKSQTENPNSQLIGRYSDFIKGEDKFLAGNRGRVDTVRSRFMNVMSLAADDKNAYMATVPNNLDKKTFEIINVAQSDMRLNAEFLPAAKLKEGRTLGELYVTGLAYSDGNLYAVSKNFNVILEINLKDQEVTKVFGLPPSLNDVRGLVKTAEGFQVLNNNNLVSLYTPSAYQQAPVPAAATAAPAETPAPEAEVAAPAVEETSPETDSSAAPTEAAPVD